MMTLEGDKWDLERQEALKKVEVNEQTNLSFSLNYVAYNSITTRPKRIPIFEDYYFNFS